MRPRQHRFSLGFWIIIAIIVLVVWMRPRKGVVIEKARSIDSETAEILKAIENYKGHFRVLPVGDSRALFQALRGRNPGQIIFYRCSDDFVSAEGDLLDPWGTPYKLYLSGDDFIIRSAGPNREFDTSADKQFDDYFR